MAEVGFACSYLSAQKSQKIIDLKGRIYYIESVKEIYPEKLKVLKKKGAIFFIREGMF